MTAPDFCSWLRTLQQYLYLQQHRKLIVLNGDLSWANSCAEQILNSYEQHYGENFSTLIWGADVQLTRREQQHSAVKNYRHQLGTENHIVFFGDSQFHPDAFAALSGTIRAGGVMVWLCPPKLITEQSDLFIQRFWQKVTNDTNTIILTPEQVNFADIAGNIDETIAGNNSGHLTAKSLTQLPVFSATHSEVQQTGQKSNDSQKTFAQSLSSKQCLSSEQYLSTSQSLYINQCLTAEQKKAVFAIEKVILGHNRRPLVLTADRGRGKSSALAIATAERLLSYSGHDSLSIIITAPHFDAVNIYFSQLAQSCPQGELKQGGFIYHQHRVEFRATDILLKEKPPAHLLLVDEAAAIPVYILSKLVDVYSRVVFSSTQHGYEGAGRGFSTKFQTILANKTPDYKKLHLNQPIRWAENDPLENLIFDGFLFNTVIENINNDQAVDNNTLKDIDVVQISQQQLFENEPLLRQVFAVLINAHYQTTPSDLKLLLNNPALCIFAAQKHGKVIGVLLAMHEGNVDQVTTELVRNSQKRLKDQFLPQSLFLYNHCQQAFHYRYLRIMRIAVVDEFQQQGIGSTLLAQVKQYGVEQQVDFLGTSFGANQALLSFWLENEYLPVHLGFTADKASGEHSVMLLNPMNDASQLFFEQIQQRFYQQFIYLLSDQYQTIEVAVIAVIINACPQQYLPSLTEFDLSVVNSFTQKQSLISSCAYSLHIWLLHLIRSLNVEQFAEQDNGLLIYHILQRHSVDSCCQHYGLTGKKQLNQKLIALVRQHINH